MADILITADVEGATHLYYPDVVMVDDDTFYFFFNRDSTLGVAYSKSTDGGLTWSAPVNLHTGFGPISSVLFSIWYDRWTPGDLGTKVRIIWDNRRLAGGRQLEYVSLDTSTDAVTSPFVLVNYSGTGVAAGFASITKVKNGNLYAHLGTVLGATFFFRSVNDGVSWQPRATVPGGFNQAALNPAEWRDDDADVAAITNIATGPAEEMTVQLREYDDSANSWASVEIVKTLVGPAFFGRRASVLRASDGHIMVSVVDAPASRFGVQSGTYDGPNNETLDFLDNGAQFITNQVGLSPGTTLKNNFDSGALWDIDSVVDETNLKVSLRTSGGGDDDWDTGDSYTITQTSNFLDATIRRFDVNGIGDITELNSKLIGASFDGMEMFADVNDDIYTVLALGTSGFRIATFFKNLGPLITVADDAHNGVFSMGVPYGMPGGGLFAPVFIAFGPSPDSAFININVPPAAIVGLEEIATIDPNDPTQPLASVEISNYVPVLESGDPVINVNLVFKTTEWKEVISTKALVLTIPGFENTPLALNYVSIEITIKGLAQRRHAPHPLISGEPHFADFRDLEEAAILLNKQVLPDKGQPEVRVKLAVPLIEADRIYDGVIKGLTLVHLPGTDEVDFILVFQATWNASNPVLREWN